MLELIFLNATRLAEKGSFPLPTHMPAARSRSFLQALVNRFFEINPRRESLVIRRVALR